MFPCNACQRTFISRVLLNHHQNTLGCCATKDRPVFSCTVNGCTTKYHRQDFLVRHERRVHGLHNGNIKRIPPLNAINYPRRNGNPTPKVPGAREPIITKSVILNVTPPERDTARFFETLRPSLCKILTGAVQQHQQIMFDISLDARLLQSASTGDTNFFEVKTFYSKDIALRSLTEVEGIVDVMIRLMVAESYDEVSKSELNEIVQLEIAISKLTPQVGGFLEEHIDIMATNAVINIRNNDSYCFKWAILTGLAPEGFQNLHLPSSYKIPDIKRERIVINRMVVDFSGLIFPLEVKNVAIFEQNNPMVSVNVFGVEEDGERAKVVGPLYRTQRERQRHINLLFFENAQRTMSHYAWIKSLTRLLKKQLGEERNLLEICNTCLTYFTTLDRFEEHKAHPANCNTPQSF